MTLTEALGEGITKVRLPEWRPGYYLEVELEETDRGPRIAKVGILHTPGDTDRVPKFDAQGRQIGDRLIPSEKRKIDTGSYRWASRYEAYTETPKQTNK